MNPASLLKIVVEGQTDAQVLRVILGRELSAQIRFFAAQGRISLPTVGRNLLVHEGGPVLLVMDSDTRNPDLASEMRSLAEVALSGAVPPGIRQASEWSRAFAFVPELEVVFFEAPPALEAVAGRRVPEELIQEGLLAPKDTLVKILREAGVAYPTLMAGLDERLGSLLATGSQAQALRATVEAMLAQAAVA